jgi:hypothetical protein
LNFYITSLKTEHMKNLRENLLFSFVLITVIKKSATIYKRVNKYDSSHH